jgi:hypothetical protein
MIVQLTLVFPIIFIVSRSPIFTPKEKSDIVKQYFLKAITHQGDLQKIPDNAFNVRNIEPSTN